LEVNPTRPGRVPFPGPRESPGAGGILDAGVELGHDQVGQRARRRDRVDQVRFGQVAKSRLAIGRVQERLVVILATGAVALSRKASATPCSVQKTGCRAR